MKEIKIGKYKQTVRMIRRILPLIVCALIGVVIGFLVSPAKKGITIGSYNEICKQTRDSDCEK